MNGSGKRVPPTKPPTTTGEKADHEAELYNQSRTRDHFRSERIKDWMGWSGVAILIAVVLLVLSAIITLGFEYLTPWGWLSDEQLQDVKTFLTSGAIISMASALYRKYMG